MAEPPAGIAQACPELETLAAYVDGRLDERTREQVSAHLADCARCYELMVEVVAAHDAAAEPAAAPASHPLPRQSSQGTGVLDLPRRPGPAWWRSRSVVVMAAGGGLAAAALLLLSFVVQPAWWTGKRAPSLAALIDATRVERTVEARLTGGFVHAPLRSPVRSGSSPVSGNLDLRIAAATLEHEAQRDPRPETLHAWGVAQLTLGQFDEAVTTLERVAGSVPADARVSSDLSAAYAARASAFGRPDDWTRALAAAERALALDPSLPEALFNRALALEGLGRTGDALAAWDAHLAVDRDSDWAAEARKHRAALP